MLDDNGKLIPDTSTIDRDVLNRLPLYQPRPTWRVDRHQGAACAGDAPGFPSYFIQHVYTQYGNSPRTNGKAPQAVILGHVIETESTPYEKVRELLFKLWKPLPYEHPRVRAWVENTYRHMKGGYYSPDILENGKPKMLFGPKYGFGEFQLKSFKDDERFSDEWREKEKAVIDQYNKEIMERWAKIEIPENYAATQYVKSFYPEHEYDADLVKNPPTTVSNWWERLPEQPTAENCPGDRSLGWKHPANNTWCQCCGLKTETAAA